MTISEKLVARLNKEFGFNIPANEKPRRLYHGYYQRAQGAWSWAIGGTITYKLSYGSQWNMETVLKAKFITVYEEHHADNSILVVDEKEYLEWVKEGRKGSNI